MECKSCARKYLCDKYNSKKQQQCDKYEKEPYTEVIKENGIKEIKPI